MEKDVVKKWYKILSFPKKYDAEFNFLVDNIPITANSICDWDYKNKSPEENILAYLYFCEDLEKRYNELGIPKNIL